MRKQALLVFGVYCLLAGSTWLGEAQLAPEWPGLLRLCAHDVLLTGLFGLIAWRRGERISLRRGAEAGWWCGLMFAAAPVVAAGAGGRVSSLTQVLVLSLVPVPTVLALGYRRDHEEGLRLLLPVLAGTGGLALLVPYAFPGSGLGWSWFAAVSATAIALAWAGIRLNEMLQEEPVFLTAALGSGVAALASGIGWRFLEAGPVEIHVRQVGVELAWALAVDGSLALMMVWLSKKTGPVSFSMRFLLLPWVNLVGGIVVMRPEVSWTSVFGLALTAGAVGYVLVTDS